MNVDEALRHLKKAISEQYWDARDVGLNEAARVVREAPPGATVVDLLQKIGGLMVKRD